MILQAPISTTISLPCFPKKFFFSKFRIRKRHPVPLWNKKLLLYVIMAFKTWGLHHYKSKLSKQRLGHTDCKGVKIYPRFRQSSSWLIITTNGQNYCVVTKTLQRMFAVKTVLYKFNKSRILVGLYDKTRPSWDNGTSASSTICIWDSLTCQHDRWPIYFLLF